jgi:chaperonin GroEL
MTIREIRFSQSARAGMARGIDLLANAVGVTLGPRGRNVAIEQPYGPPYITKDGVAVAREIELEDRFADMGAQLIKMVASRTHDHAGDGTTSATVIAQAILNEGMKSVVAGANPMDLKRGIDLAVKAVVGELKARSRPLEGTQEVARVATISANGDEAAGRAVAQAIDRVGKTGVVMVERSIGTELEVEIVEGLRFDGGYLSPYFMTNVARSIVELDDPLLLLHDKKLSNAQALVPILNEVAQSGRPLLIVAEAMEGGALATVVVNKLNGTLQVAAIKAPGYGDRRMAMLEDLAVLTGSEIISQDMGMKIESATLSMLGSARRIVIEKDRTTVIGGCGNADAIKDRVASLERQVAMAGEGLDREGLRERLARLSGGVAIIKVGGGSDMEVAERLDRVDDALRAAQAAMDEGVLPGGGTALLYAAKALHGLNGVNADQDRGVAIIRHALREPLRRICDNAGHEGSAIATRLQEGGDENLGFNAQTERYENLFQSGIIDAAKVVRCGLQDAASVAGLLITTEVAIGDWKAGARSVSFPANHLP